MRDLSTRIPAGTSAADGADVGIVKARNTEDVVAGEEIVRHRLLTRAIHWSVAVFMLLCLFTGLPIWTPVFGWMAYLFGGLAVCRWLHPWVGVLFFVSSAVMFFHWLKEMRLERHEWDWLGPKLFQYMRYQSDDSQTGKYNGGQKLFFFAAALAALALMLSGFVLWFPLDFTQPLRQASWLVHDFAFILFTIAVVGHIYLGTAAEPGTFAAMTRGTVTKKWARFHHPRWYREVTGEGTRRS